MCVRVFNELHDRATRSCPASHFTLFALLVFPMGDHRVPCMYVCIGGGGGGNSSRFVVVVVVIFFPPVKGETTHNSTKTSQQRVSTTRISFETGFFLYVQSGILYEYLYGYFVEASLGFRP